MVKIYKPGKVAIVLQGRQAGKKVVVIQQHDEGTKERPYPHAVVAGIERYPRKVTRRMGEKKLKRRSTIKPFIKAINYSHLFPTRYTLEMEGLKNAVDGKTVSVAPGRDETVTVDDKRVPARDQHLTSRESTKKNLKKVFEDRYTNGKDKWFFQALRF